MYKSTTFVALSAHAALVAAQSAVTIYDISLVPEPTSGAGGLAGQLDRVIDALVLGGGDIRASAVAVDTAGATYYVGVQQVSAVPTNIGSVLTTVVLPTPTTTTFTFRADASRVLQDGGIETTIQGVEANIVYGVECTHDVDADTPVEEGVIVCKGNIQIAADVQGQTVAETIALTRTGQAVPLVTVTNQVNLNLPTSGVASPEVTAAFTLPGRPVSLDPSGSGAPSSTPQDDGSGHKREAGAMGFIAAGILIACQLL